MSRGLVPYVQKYLPNKVDIVVENVRGAGGVVGTTATYTADPDGYTIGLTNPAGLVSADLTREIQFDLE